MKLHAIMILAFTLTFAGSSAGPADLALPESDDERLGYSIGYQVGEDFRRQGLTIAVDLVVEGAMHALTGAEPRFTRSEMREALLGLGRQVEGKSLPTP